MNGQSESYGSNKNMMDESGMFLLSSLEEALSVNDILENSSTVVNKQNCLAGQCKADRFQCELPSRNSRLRSTEVEDDILTEMTRHRYFWDNWEESNEVTKEKLKNCVSGRCKEKLFPCRLSSLSWLSFRMTNSKTGVNIKDLPDGVLAMCITSNPLNARLVCSQWKDVVFKHHWKLGIIQCLIYRGENLNRKDIRWINRKEMDMDIALEEFKRKWTARVGGNDEFGLIKSDSDWTTLYVNQNENKLTLETLPSEMLATCLSHTGRDLLNARLTCRRLSQTVEEWECMMNVVFAKSLRIKKTPKSRSYIICQWLTSSRRKGREVRCRLNNIMKYIRFYKPEELIVECLENDVDDLKKYLTESWRKSIVTIEICRKTCDRIFSIFPNVNTLNYNPYNRNGSVLAEMASIFANPPQSIRRLRLKRNCVENDSSLDVLMQMQMSHKLCQRIESLEIDPPSSFSIESIIRLIENIKFGEKFELSLTVVNFGHYTNYSDDEEVFWEPDLAYNTFLEWTRLQESRGLLKRTGRYRHSITDFVYRSTKFHLNFDDDVNERIRRFDEEW